MASFGLIALVAALISNSAAAQNVDKASSSIRVAAFNADMNREGAGVLVKDIGKRDEQVLNVAEIVLRVRPDILLINEIDHDPEGLALNAFRTLLAEGVRDVEGMDFDHHFLASSNTGEPLGLDLDGDGKIMGARDAKGFGRFPGQYGMALLSRFPIASTRTFKDLLWASIPWAQAPINPDGTAYYSDEAWSRLPMSSKSHWDVRIVLPNDRAVHILASHPTPPVFDGPENRNGLRNAAEIRFWTDYIDNAGWIKDDDGVQGGLPSGASFAILGDLNNDPEDGDGDEAAVRALLDHPRVQDPKPRSTGGAVARGRISDRHDGDAALDTADWHETEDGPGNLRVDYALPSSDLNVTGSGVFWPAPDDPLARLIAVKGRTRASSDHRLVWFDLALEKP
ncbi:MAG: endonuclease/exonuclease/phosphatase family protein [Pseudomonadota bacterium]